MKRKVYSSHQKPDKVTNLISGIRRRGWLGRNNKPFTIVYYFEYTYALCKKRVVVQNKSNLLLRIFWNSQEYYNYLQLM